MAIRMCIGAGLVVLLFSSFSHGASWKLIWSDEFDYSGLPDKTKWGYEEGFKRNRESQFYVAGRAENAPVEEGHLVIEARRERWPNPEYDPDARRSWRRSQEYAEYTSASLTTQAQASWTYGRVEVRAKLPRGRGLWPAIWMLGTNINEVGWPRCGEIDIMEYVGHDPNRIHGNVHMAKYNHTRGTGKGAKISVEAPYEAYHVYAIEWTPKKIDITFDSELYFTFDNEGTGTDVWPFDDPHYLILNIAVGGSWGGQQGIDESVFPQQLLVDYVRVYRAGE